MEWLELAVSILAGLAAAIPLVIKLVEYVKKAVKEKNWGIVLNMVMDYMKVAETKFATGAERKEWVLDMIKTTAKTVNYDIDITIIDKLIDDLCSMTKAVNPPAETAGK